MLKQKHEITEFDKSSSGQPITGRSLIGDLLYNVMNDPNRQTASGVGLGVESRIPLMSAPFMAGMSRRYTPGMKFAREMRRNPQVDKKLTVKEAEKYLDLITSSTGEQVKIYKKTYRDIGREFNTPEPSPVQKYKLQQLLKGNPKYRDAIKPDYYVYRRVNIEGDDLGRLNKFVGGYMSGKPMGTDLINKALRIAQSKPGGREFLESLPNLSKSYRVGRKLEFMSEQGQVSYTPKSPGGTVVNAQRSNVERMIKKGELRRVSNEKFRKALKEVSNAEIVPTTSKELAQMYLDNLQHQLDNRNISQEEFNLRSEPYIREMFN